MDGAPRIQSPAVIGVRPGTPLHHRVRVLGAPPFEFGASLLDGLSLDSNSGQIAGVLKEAGEHRLSVTVANEAGKATWNPRLVVGDRLAMTPPQGWMSWNAFGRDLSEAAVLGNADAIIQLGLRDAGYEYICLDDHWHGGRGADGRLFPDLERFSHGIGWLADELHRRGLKLGIYTCAGELTCGGEAGSEGFEALDAQTFADWGVDYVKDDYCHAPPEREAAIERYGRMGEALARSGRSIVFAVCEWGGRAPWEWAPSVHASLWRTTGDVHDAWSGDGGIITLADATEPLADWAGPGGWNDPDMLVAGLRGHSRPGAAGMLGCTDAEYRTQVSLWALMAAPMHVSCDLRAADDATVAVLTAPSVLAIDQDPLGEPGRRVERIGSFDLWERRLADGDSAFAVVNRRDGPASAFLDWPRVRGAPPEVIDAWTDEPFDSRRRHDLEPHATALYRVSSGQLQGLPTIRTLD